MKRHEKCQDMPSYTKTKVFPYKVSNHRVSTQQYWESSNSDASLSSSRKPARLVMSLERPSFTSHAHALYPAAWNVELTRIEAPNRSRTEKAGGERAMTPNHSTKLAISRSGWNHLESVKRYQEMPRAPE